MHMNSKHALVELYRFCGFPRMQRQIMLAYIIACLGEAVLAVPAIAADAFPSAPIRIVVAFPPGGGSDLVARILANYMSESLRVSVLVDNRPGASGLIGTELAAKAPADGYTLTLPDVSHILNAFVFKNPRYDPIRDFSPVSLVGTAPVVLVVHPRSPYQSVRDYIARAKRDPNHITIGSGGTGTLPYMAAELFQLRTGARLSNISYKGGAPALNDVTGGHIESRFPIVTAGIAFINAKRLRALAVSSAKRLSALPEVPTFEEAGVADFYVSNWYGVLAPAGTPAEIVSRINREIVAAAQTDAVRQQFEKLVLEPATSTPGQFASFMEADMARWSQVVKQAGIQAE